MMIFLIAWLFIWAKVMYDNIKTRDDRLHIIDKIYDRADYRRYSQEFERVSYERHLLARVMFQDWKKIYSQELQEILK